MTLFNLFALTSDPELKILRFPLSQQVQQELTDYLKEQEANFNNSAQEEIAFDGKYKPDDGECLVIENYDDIDDLQEAVANPLSIPEISPDPTEFAMIKALFSGYKHSDGATVILLQNFERRKILSTKGISIFHSGNVYKKVDGIGVTVDAKLSAIIKGATLRFFSFHVARQIFDLTEYYKEATDADINEFAAIPVLRVPAVQQLIEMSDSWVRRKLVLVTQSGILDAVPVSVIQAAAAEFSIKLVTAKEGNNDVIVPPGIKAELKKLLKFLDEDYYTSPLSARNYVSNSKRPA